MLSREEDFEVMQIETLEQELTDAKPWSKFRHSGVN